MIVAGLFSAKEAEPQSLLRILSDQVEIEGGKVIGTVLQRKGVSHGGARHMGTAISPATHLGTGKAKELAALSKKEGADLILFWNELSGTQTRNLEKLCDAVVRDRQALGLTWLSILPSVLSSFKDTSSSDQSFP